MTDRHLSIIAALNLFLAVAAGAFGAHGLKKMIPPELLVIWQTGVTYHMIHALGLFVVALAMPRFSPRILIRAGLFMLLGIILFSGSLYLLAITGIRDIGIITPFGGIAFLVSWLLIAWAAYCNNIAK